ncbi:hypothetical protein ACFCT7_06730 [Fulvivirgaceae bacterium LMO-SS25]
MKLALAISILYCHLVACSNSERLDIEQRDVDFDRFGTYWYQGKAELNSYELTQYRYGESVQGEAVLIFVTEDFSRSKKVKVDKIDAENEDQVKVMKLNSTRDFLTGIYPYHMMSSTFTPIYGDEQSLKITASSQEWCGQSFTLLEREDIGFETTLHSYFESEANFTSTVSGVLEDELWNLIRLNPNLLPEGEFMAVPGALSQRMSHAELKAYNANAELVDSKIEFMNVDRPTKKYSINYPEIGRELMIYFDAEFPFEILAWEEKSSSRDQGYTRAIRKGNLMLDYWKRNSSADTVWRDSLNLR